MQEKKWSPNGSMGVPHRQVGEIRSDEGRVGRHSLRRRENWKLSLERRKSQSVRELPINGKLVIGERSELRTASGGSEGMCVGRAARMFFCSDDKDHVGVYECYACG